MKTFYVDSVFISSYYLKKVMKGVYSRVIFVMSTMIKISGGKVDVDRHIKENSLFIGNIAYTRENIHLIII